MPKPTAYDPGKRLRPLLASLTQQVADKGIPEHTHGLDDLTGINGSHGDIIVSDQGQTWEIAPDAVGSEEIADGAVGSSEIQDESVTYDKLQNVSEASKLLGRGSENGAGDVEEIILGTGLRMIGTTINVLSTSEEEWLFSTSTVMGNPGTGKFRTDHTTFAGSAGMVIATLSNDSVDMSNTLRTVRVDDQISVQDKSNAANWVRYRVAGIPMDNGTHWFFAIEFIEGGGVIPNNNSPALVRFTEVGAGGSPGPAQNVFQTFSVPGQGNVVADGPTDTLNLLAGTNVVITTDPSTDSITINSLGGGGGGPAAGFGFLIDDGNSTGSGEDFWFDDGGAT